MGKPIFDECRNFVGMCRHYFHGYGKKIFLWVRHMFDSLLNEFMKMKDFWVDWDIVRMLWYLNL